MTAKCLNEVIESAKKEVQQLPDWLRTARQVQRTGYVLGFMFDTRREAVALITKNKPAWQAGKLNGIGGKIESGETPSYAMAREFWEEAGITTGPSSWEEYALIEASGYSVHCFRSFCHSVFDAHSKTEEVVGVFDIAEIGGIPHLPNLPWLISLALDGEPLRTTIQYK